MSVDYLFENKELLQIHPTCTHGPPQPFILKNFLAEDIFSVSIYIIQIFAQTLECMADTRWELRRMAHQVNTFEVH